MRTALVAAIAALVLVPAASCREASGVTAPGTAPPPPPAAAREMPPERHRGVSWVAGRRVAAEDLAPLASHHVNWIVQTPFGWQREHDSPAIALATSGRIFWGETDEGLEVTTRLARELGVRTLLKPHVYLTRAGGKWRADIAMRSEEDWQRWFADYRTFILHYARLAERLGIEGLAVGTELHATVRERPGDWRRLIAEVRAVYRGKLTYSANWYREFEEVTFWDLLDYVGIQAYFPLTDRVEPTVEELMAGWQRHLPAIEKVARRAGKPVLFTEVGYRNTADAATDPWRWPSTPEQLFGLAEPETQARCYEAFFRTFWQREWVAGAYFWKWYPGDPYIRRVDFSPQGQRAAAVMAAWYRRDAGRQPAMAAPTTPD